MEEGVITQANSEEIQPRKEVTGKIVKMSMAAALVDIGTEKPAVLHVSQITTPSRQPIKRVEDVFEIGQEVNLWIKREDDDVIQLTMIKPLDLRWKDIKDGMVVKGKVVRLETFGAFVEIGAERPGLVHISEIAHGYIKTPAEVLEEGQEIEALVLETNRKKKQIKLSIKALLPAPEAKEDDAEAQQPRERRNNRRKGGGRRRRSEMDEVNEVLASMNEPAEETETTLGAAIREAMERAQQSAPASKKSKKAGGKSDNAQEDILARTLNQRSS
ncbi:MAG: S1 RNA-binding domain-containing protein [Anaerolineaceae bacterium]|nr:S1 RNA-binding domain-containing protein [Anaerolineaceae bacterium]